jgi:hypothetical protein
MSAVLDGRVTKLFEDKDRWTSDHAAETASGESVHALLWKESSVTVNGLNVTPPVSLESAVHDPRAECWCLVGAIYKCYRDHAALVRNVANERCQSKYGTTLARLNDLWGYDKVMELCREINL